MFRVLMADDDIWVRRSLKLLDWESHGMEIVSEAENGPEAIDAITRCAPDIVLMDVRMPGLDGLEVMRRTRESNSHTAFVVISGFESFEYALEALRLGAWDYMLKPINNDDLMEMLDTVVARLRARRENDFLAAKYTANLRQLIGQYQFQNLYNLITAFNAPGVHHMLGEIFTRLEKGELEPQLYGVVLQYFLVALQDFCKECGMDFTALTSHLSGTQTVETRFTSLDRVKDYVIQLIMLIMERLRTKEESDSTRIIAEMLRHINACYDQELSLGMLSARYHLNSSYLSRVFKNKTGVTLTAYITRVRMEKAHALLMEGGRKVHEVAEMVGYHDARYFTIVFKKTFGVSPSALLSDDEGEP